jgi:hypothetical protein
LHATVQSDDEMAPLFERIVGMPIEYETLYVGKWRQRLMLADRYRDGRVFLAGDSAHLVIPTGGLGMNTGHGDAVDLAWKLSATLHGWGGAALLDSYEAERRPIGARNIAASRRAAAGRATWRGKWRPELALDTDEGRKVRQELADTADTEQRWSNDLYGIELGYVYRSSPVMDYGADAARESDVDDLNFQYTPTTETGARLPHIWLDNGAAIQDVLDREFTLLTVGMDEDPKMAELAASFAALDAPFRVFAPPSEHAEPVYGRGFLLVRPDLHIAWRGSSLPSDPAQLARMVTGRA